ncbi:MAG: copper amine oxidase N-terminal domain-containing protein [Ruminococcaceae bacterium]|nr:copper amine oxidase N-terminal domain-containing protein [Oscillospiraceae bacterium]
MKRGNARSFLLGVLVTVLVFALALPAAARSGSKTAELFYRNIKINFNGTQITPKDANGNTVEPFIIDGTTYLPVRAVANALGLNVGWDEGTSTVLLSTGPNGTAEESDSLKALRVSAHYKGFMLAAAYVGFDFDTLSDELDLDGIRRAYEGTDDTMFVDAGGSEVYVLVPSDPAAELSIYNSTITEDGDLVPTGKPLYEGGAAPVILRCNYGDIPSVVVCVKDSAGDSAEFYPCLSGRDGSLAMDNVYDYTHYPDGFEFED